MLFRTVRSPTPYGLLFPKIGGLQPPPKTPITTNFKLCMRIHRIDRNKSPLQISENVAVHVLRDSQKFSGHPYIGRIAHRSLQ